MGPDRDTGGRGDFTALSRRIALAHRLLSAATLEALQEAATDVAAGELAVLTVLVDEGPKRTSALSYSLGVPPSSLTRYADRLFDLGYISRQRDPNDRREIRVDVTEAGRSALHEVRARLERDLGDRLSDLSEHDRRSLTRALDRLASLMDSDRALEREKSA